LVSIGRVQAALSVVLDARVVVEPAAGSVKNTGTDVSLVTLAERTVSIAWLPVGWPKQVREILSRAVVPDLVAAPEMSAERGEQQRTQAWAGSTGPERRTSHWARPFSYDETARRDYD
jgi:hypothetical protein